MADYQLFAKQLVNGSLVQNAVIRKSDNTIIPFDADNTHYQTYLSWVDAGNTPDPVS